MKQNLVVIGNGMAGIRTVEELLTLAPDTYDITVFGAEPHGNYNRILLSPVLAGEKTLDDIMLNHEDWYLENGITLIKGVAVTGIDRHARRITAADGSSTPYDRLLIATGSDPIMLPVPGNNLAGVVAFRNIRDVHQMCDVAESDGQAVVIGGGLLGLEAAHGLAKQGMNVTVVHLLDTLMEQQLDAGAGAMLRRSLEDRGINFVMPAETEALLGDEHVRAVRFKDGREIPADLVVIAVGTRPNAHLAEKAGLYVERGIVTTDTMQTFDGRIYAVGECAQHRGRCYGLVAPLFEQAKVCANHLAELGYATYKGSVTSARLKVAGIDLFSAGEVEDRHDTETVVMQDAARGIYKKIVLRENRVEGTMLYGDAADATWYFGMMRDGTDVSGSRDRLLYGQSYLGDAGHGDESTILTMSDDTEVCGCNDVCKGDIVDAITSKQLFTLEDVRLHTKASSSCGSCTGLVEQLLAVTQGGDFSEAPTEKPLCGCTDYSHDQVRHAIKDNELKTISDAMAFMEWRLPDGCAACRQALNYYLLCAWPGEYADDRQSRCINERIHANIQKDGTYSVVPRMWGGISTPDELRAIADAADKYKARTVHVTGGQRIDLLGINKEDLPAIWEDLNEAGLVSGHAYGKAVRTVKTCVGSEWCRFGTQDSTQMGILLERMSWGAWMPHKFKMAVSGCPRNCAEATIKDFGVVAVSAGWELHVGGNGGVKVRATDLLCKVGTEEEVLEYCGAFMQFYREHAHYLERTAPWIERIGLAAVKKRVVDDAAGRSAFFERFLLAQRYAQEDPWRKGSSTGPDRSEFQPLMEVVNA